MRQAPARRPGGVRRRARGERGRSGVDVAAPRRPHDRMGHCPRAQLRVTSGIQYHRGWQPVHARRAVRHPRSVAADSRRIQRGKRRRSRRRGAGPWRAAGDRGGARLGTAPQVPGRMERHRRFAVPCGARLRPHPRRHRAGAGGAAAADAGKADHRLRLRRRARQRQAFDDGAPGGGRCRRCHRLVRQSPPRGSRPDHRRRRLRIAGRCLHPRARPREGHPDRARPRRSR